MAGGRTRSKYKASFLAFRLVRQKIFFKKWKFYSLKVSPAHFDKNGVDFKRRKEIDARQKQLRDYM